MSFFLRPGERPVEFRYTENPEALWEDHERNEAVAEGVALARKHQSGEQLKKTYALILEQWEPTIGQLALWQ